MEEMKWRNQVRIEDHIDININFEKRFFVGEIPLPAARKHMIVKIIGTRPPTTATVIVCSVPEIICNPCFASGVAKIANYQIQHV